MKNPFLNGLVVGAFCLILLAAGKPVRPGYAARDAFLGTCAVGATTFPTVNAQVLLITVRSTATVPVWIGPVGGTSVGDGLQLHASGGATAPTFGPVEIPVVANANELDCIRDGASDVDLTVLVLR